MLRLSDVWCIGLGNAIAWLGVSVIVLGILGDWLRRRWGFAFRLKGNRTLPRRCPRCWYDLSHTHGLRCSECGYVAKRERSLHRARRRWRWVIVGLLILAAGYSLRVTPAIKERGWVGAVPVTTILLAMPILEPVETMRACTWGNTPGNSWRERLVADLLQHRMKDDRLWTWQSAWLARICLRGSSEVPPLGADWLVTYGATLERMVNQAILGGKHPRWLTGVLATFEVQIDTRPVWPAETPVFARVSIKRAYVRMACTLTITAPNLRTPIETNHPVPSAPRDPSWNDGLVGFGSYPNPLSKPALQAALRVERRTTVTTADVAHKRSMRAPFDVRGTVDDLLKPVSSEALEHALRACLRPVLNVRVDGANSRGSLWLWNDLGADQAAALDGPTYAFAIDILCGDRLVGHGRAWFEIDRDAGQTGWFTTEVKPLADIVWDAAALEETNARGQESGWSVRLRGDAVTALRNFACTQYWRGDMTLPLEVRIVNAPRSK